MSAQNAREIMGNLDATAVNANWGRNMLIASKVLGKAAGISWHAVECDEQLTVVDALRNAMTASEYKYDQLVEGMALLARYLVWIDLATTPGTEAADHQSVAIDEPSQRDGASRG